MTTIARYAFAATAGLLAIVANLPAEPASAAATDSAAETITCEQYSAWRMHFIEERQVQIAAGLADNNPTDARRASLQRQKAYDEHFAAIPRDDRDRLFSERFDEISANRDGVIDRNERTAWHDGSAPSTIDYRREGAHDKRGTIPPAPR
jgi:hypothetical protein